MRTIQNTELCDKCGQWYAVGDHHICLNKSFAELKAEVRNASALAAQRNAIIGTMGQEIERLRNELTAANLERDALRRKLAGADEAIRFFAQSD